MYKTDYLFEGKQQGLNNFFFLMGNLSPHANNFPLQFCEVVNIVSSEIQQLCYFLVFLGYLLTMKLNTIYTSLCVKF